MSLTISPSPFGSLVVSVAETGSTLSVTTVATSPSVLTMALGVPGPAGATGSQGPAGTNGTNGVGVAAGGTTGQALVKLSGTNYDTGWATITSGGGTWGSITGTLSNQTDLYSALNDKLSLSGGTMSGTIFLPSLRNLLNTDLTVTAYNDTGAGTNFIHTFDAFDGTFALATNGGGLKFPDATVQTTAGLPLTGGTVDGDITISNYYSLLFNSGTSNVSLNAEDGLYVSNNISSISLTASNIIFPDETVQTTAGLPLTGGTMADDVSIILNDTNNGITATLTGNQLTVHNDEDNTDTFINGTNVGASNVTTGQNLYFNSAGIHFPDSSVQITAFIPADWLSTSAAYSTFLTQSSAASTYFPNPTGTTSQYIRGDGSLYTFPPVGDRYLTSSTTTLTVDSGNGKTMTVGTGLSYSPQQDITVSYNTANHMHGTVLTYNSTTGVMTWDSNTHSGSGTYSSWEVNVGGVAGAVLPVGGTTGQVLAKINSTNFNTEWLTLGTMSTEPASAYLSTASAVANYLTISSASSTYQTQSGMSSYLSTASAVANYLTISNASSTYQTQSGMSAYLSTSAAASTYQTQAGMSAYLSTSAAASTYQTQSGMSAYLSTASASANFIGTSAYATTAQAEAMTSTTAVISPARFRDAYFTANVNKPNTSTWTTGTSGTGGVNDSATWDNRRLQGPTSAANTYVRCDHGINQGRGRYWANNIDWTKYAAFSFRISQNVSSPDSNSIFRAVLGEVNGVNTGDPTVRSVGIKFNANGVIKILAHDGTTLTTYSTSTSLAQNVAQDILIVSDGSGTVTVYSNGTSIGSTTGGPTTLLAGTAQQNNMNFRIENNNTPSGNQLSCVMSGITVYTS